MWLNTSLKEPQNNRNNAMEQKKNKIAPSKCSRKCKIGPHGTDAPDIVQKEQKWREWNSIAMHYSLRFVSETKTEAIILSLAIIRDRPKHVTAII